MLTNLILSLCMAVLSIVILTQTAAFPSCGNISAVDPEVIPNYLAYIIFAITAYLGHWGLNFFEALFRKRC